MSNKSYTEEEINETLSTSENLIRYGEELLVAGKVMFQRLGIPRGSTRRILNDPLASRDLKEVGRIQIQQWKESLGPERRSSGNVAIRKKSKRNLIAI